MKKEMTSVDVAAVLRELEEFEGAKFDKFYQYDDDKFRIKMRDYDAGRLELIIETGETKRIHLTEDPDEAPSRPPDLPMLMRKRLSGGDLTGVDQYDFDRIVEIHGERGGEEYTIVAELFGDGNFVFLNSDREVLRSLNTVRLKSRTVAPGEKYGFPPSRLNPMELSYDDFVSLMEESDTDLVRTLASQLNFGGLYAEEICMRAGVEKELSVGEADEETYELLYEAMTSVFEPFEKADFDPHIVYSDDASEDSEDSEEYSGEILDVLPFELEKYSGNKKEFFDTFNQALDAYFEELEEVETEEEVESSLEQEIQKQKHIIRQQEEAIEGFEEEQEELREKAETLYEHYSKVDELLSTVRSAVYGGVSWDEVEKNIEEGKEKGIESADIVVDLDEDNEEVTVELDGKRIPLDIHDGVESNASSLYDEAKALDDKKEGALEAMEEREKELERLKKKIESEDLASEKRDETVIKPRGEKWYDRFRWFRTSDDFLVIGGRNADQNEEIHKKYMEKNDLFFHTQAQGAPITVLKTTEPDEALREVEVPERSKQEAAVFAASYSSVWDAGQFSADVYSASPEQVSKTPESGEYIQKGSVVVRGDRTYYRDVPLGVAIGLRLDREAGTIGGPPEPVKRKSDYWIELEPGRYSQNDAAKKVYREFRDMAGKTSVGRDSDDEKLVRKFASPDKIQKFLPSGGSRIKTKMDE